MARQVDDGKVSKITGQHRTRGKTYQRQDSNPKFQRMRGQRPQTH